MSSLKALLTTGPWLHEHALMLPAAHAQITVTEGHQLHQQRAVTSLNVSQGKNNLVGRPVQVLDEQLHRHDIYIEISSGADKYCPRQLLGMNDTQTTTINIENITANGNGGNINSQGGSNIVAEGIKFASGQTGIVA